tara:strand:- start:22 stop:282 length:261 start_codon:yes stop_codon:yes gene_type:complete
MIINIILGIALIVCIYIIYNLMRKVEDLEDSIVNQYNQTSRINETLSNMQEKMKEIDETGAFESDDQVGEIFNQLKSIISQGVNYE